MNIISKLFTHFFIL